MNDVLTTASVFLIHSLFSFYIFLMALRLLLQIVHASVHNPITQFVIRATNPMVRPLQSVLPRWKGVDWAIVVVLLLLQAVELFFVLVLRNTNLPHFSGIFCWTLGNLGQVLSNIYFYAILLRAILSWIMPVYGSPIMEVSYVLTQPLLNYFRRWLPSLGGIDLSPLFAIIILQLFSILLCMPLIEIGQAQIL